MQNIFNKLAKIQKAEPKRSKFAKATPKRVSVKLSIIDDIESNLSWFEEAESSASYLAYEWGDELISIIDDYRSEIGKLDDYVVNGQVRSLEEVAGILEDALNDLKTKAEELGIEPNELYADFDDLYNRVQNSVDLINDSQDKYKEVVEYSGVLNNFW